MDICFGARETIVDIEIVALLSRSKDVCVLDEVV